MYIYNHYPLNGGGDVKMFQYILTSVNHRVSKIEKKIKKDVQKSKITHLFFRVRRQNVILHFDVFTRVFYNRGSKCTITFLRWDHVDDVKK